MLKLGAALDPVATPVIPIQVTPDHSDSVSTYLVAEENVGVTEVNAGQSRQTRTAEQVPVVALH